ncbi:hypothetical protein [Chelativorans salis]|uniref:Copper resistance protein D domain-containing protein n=1 Tax=Chelativorans salis TaxID=2978478 RepID=A0ABT2LHG2_9HYPH|nr:hypothetical protein [Chelativorans sp. EGI FJ00035]MCT7373606.1 hypothetical protein [Chelativorans sp. EGI FJ00035]
MLTFMKILHLFGLMLGAGGGLGSMMVGIQAKRAGGPPPPALLALRKNFALAALIGVLLLWATGLWMWLVDYGGAWLGTAFAVKIAAAVLILAILVAARIAMARTAPGSPPPAFIQRLGPVSGLLSYIAVALAVIVFT